MEIWGVMTNDTLEETEKAKSKERGESGVDAEIYTADMEYLIYRIYTYIHIYVVYVVITLYQ
jgi:hypothetical protein